MPIGACSRTSSRSQSSRTAPSPPGARQDERGPQLERRLRVGHRDREADELEAAQVVDVVPDEDDVLRADAARVEQVAQRRRPCPRAPGRTRGRAWRSARRPPGDARSRARRAAGRSRGAARSPGRRRGSRDTVSTPPAPIRAELSVMTPSKSKATSEIALGPRGRARPDDGQDPLEQAQILRRVELERAPHVHLEQGDRSPEPVARRAEEPGSEDVDRAVLDPLAAERPGCAGGARAASSAAAGAPSSTRQRSRWSRDAESSESAPLLAHQLERPLDVGARAHGRGRLEEDHELGSSSPAAFRSSRTCSSADSELASSPESSAGRWTTSAP